MRVHELKIWPEFFAPMAAGTKTFEMRTDDRGFAVGDLLRLREYAVLGICYTGREIIRKVSYIARGIPGLPEGFVIMAVIEPDIKEPPNESRSL